MQQRKCYLCDSDIEGSSHPFKIGLREELVCDECYVKTVNRRKAMQEEGSKKSPSKR